jgi:hypothetical protein
LRKILFVLFAGVLIGGLVLALIAWDAVRRLSPEDVRRQITQAVKAESGLDLVAGRVTTQISYHVIITFHSARLLNGNQQVARFARISLICGYRTLLFHRGLPFLSVAVEQPEVILPLRSVTPGPLPVFDAESVADFRRLLVRLSNITRQLIMFRATVEDRGGRVLFDEAAVRATHGRAASAWQLRFKGYFRGVGLPNFRIGASLTMAPEMDGPNVPFARGSLWFWDAALEALTTQGFSLKGRLRGNLTFLVRNDGLVSGQGLSRVAGFQLASARISQPLRLNELTLSARLSHSAAGLEVSQFAMRDDTRELLSGSASLVPRPPGDLRVRARLSPLSFSTAQLKAALLQVRGLPAWLSQNARLVSAGTVSVEELTLDSTLKDLEAPTLEMLKQMAMRATLDGLAFTPPDFPAVAELVGRLDYNGGAIRLTQSHASFGNSTLADIRLSCDLSRATGDMPYQGALAGELDVGEIYAAAHKLMPAPAVRPLERIKSVRGKAVAEVDLRGHVSHFAILDPPDYRATLRPKSVTVAVASLPAELRAYGGSVSVTPHALFINQLDVAPRHGSLSASGRIDRPTPASFEVSKLTLELHHIQAEEWLPHLIAMDTMDVHGPASGILELSRGSDGARRYRADGKLEVGPGEINFAFLRSPVILNGLASVTLDGWGGALTIRSAKLEDSLIDMTVSVADVGKPLIQIDALAQRLDLEAIRAVRLPWTPKTPIKHDDTPFAGRVLANEANLARLYMKNLKASFKRDSTDWRVFDINADTLGGHLTMDLSGRKRDDWVHIRTRAEDLDANQIQALANSQTVLTGRLTAEGDLWADTNDDFFSTLAGSVAATVRKGVLLKLKILSRMLSLVDVSEWLNAQVPDPRVNGVPFRTITASFTGEGGIFRTRDFLLDGPVMKITAFGQVNVAQTALDVTVGMRPFQLLDTVFNKIPFIGSRLAQSQSGIVSAYFHVNGPISDPTVFPAPITSISHMLIKTLAIPINILIPETVK